MSIKHLLNNKVFQNFSEWSLYNKKITGYDLSLKTFKEIKKECLLYIFNKNKIGTINTRKQPIVQMKDILYIDDKLITCFQQVTNKEKIYIRKLCYEERILIVPKDHTEHVDMLVDKYLSVYVKNHKRITKIERERRAYVKKKLYDIEKESKKLFTWETNPVDMKDLAEKESDPYSYYCPYCKDYFSYAEPRVRCKVCKHYLIELQKELIEKDYK